VILLDEDVDSAHASIEARGDRWILQDLGAPGGTWVNEEEVTTPRRLFGGDMIRLNQVVMKFNEDKERPISSQDSVPSSDSTSDTSSKGGETQKKQKQPRLWLEIGIALIVLLFAATFMLGNDRAIVEFLRGQDKPPGLRTLTDDLDVTVSPGQSVYFLTEARDENGLDRVEFRVNGELVDTKRPPSDHVVKMQTMHHWSGDEAGEYELKVIAYDKAGKRSKSLIMLVTVEGN